MPETAVEWPCAGRGWWEGWRRHTTVTSVHARRWWGKGRRGHGYVVFVFLAALLLLIAMATAEHMRWRRKRRHGRQWGRLPFWHRPHLHDDRPIWLDHRLPNLRKDDLAIGTDEVKVTIVYVLTNWFDVEKSLMDESFHSLSRG